MMDCPAVSRGDVVVASKAHMYWTGLVWVAHFMSEGRILVVRDPHRKPAAVWASSWRHPTPEELDRFMATDQSEARALLACKPKHYQPGLGDWVTATTLVQGTPQMHTARVVGIRREHLHDSVVQVFLEADPPQALGPLEGMHPGLESWLPGWSGHCLGWSRGIRPDPAWHPTTGPHWPSTLRKATKAEIDSARLSQLQAGGL